MWEDIVLGTVPGTQIQVSFEMWLAAVMVPLSAFLLYRIWRSDNVQWLVVMFKIRNAMHTTGYRHKLNARSHIQAA